MKTLRNKVQLIGRLGHNPEIINLDDGKKIAKFSMATNEHYKDPKGEKIENTQWHNVVSWGHTASFIEEYILKGQEIAIEGRLNHKKYEDKNKVTHYTTEIIANEIIILNSPRS